MMATNLQSDIPPSPQNGESDAEDADYEESSQADDNQEDNHIKKSSNNNVTGLLERLKASGALLTKPKKEYRCVTCDEDYPDWESLESHLIEHVSLPAVVINKLPSDDEDASPSGDEDWSDEEEDGPTPVKTPQKTPQKLDISKIMQKTGLSIKKSNQPESKDSALSKLSGLGITLKKSVTPIKEEKPEPEQTEKLKPASNIMEKLEKLGGLKLKLKSDGNNTNSFKVVDGLKNFKTSDDEEEEDGDNEEDENEEDTERPIKVEKNKIDDEKQPEDDYESDEEHNTSEHEKDDDSDETGIPLADKKIRKALNNLRSKQKGKVQEKEKPNAKEKQIKEKEEVKPSKSPPKETPPAPAPPVRRGIKQTPKRGANLPLSAMQAQPSPTQSNNVSTTSTPERRESHDSNNSNTERVVVKQEPEANEPPNKNSTTPLFSGQIKTERSSPSPPQTTPIISSIKTEPESAPVSSSEQQLFQNSKASSTTAPTNLLPVKTEDSGMTIIEINGDSNDEDDDCCVVSATPAPDIKPVIPKTENVQPSYSLSNVTFPSSQSTYTLSTEKQHSFNWNAPDSKPNIDLLTKNADDALFDSLISAKKESLSDAGEYISLDTLGPNHSCEVCNTRFTSISLLEDHKKMTGHSMSLVMSSPSSSTILPYSSSSNLFSSLLPVKQLAEQVGKLSGMGSGPGFTHQQNVMINIQAYPGQGGVMSHTQPYNSYPPGQGVSPGYAPTTNPMYGGSPQSMPPQYPGQNYMGPSGYAQQYQPPMSMPQTSMYSGSPLQGMEQAVYGQSPMNNQPGMMGPPSMSPYVPTSSPAGMMKPPTSSGSNVRIQNVQTIAPGQTIAGKIIGSEMGPPGQPPPTQMPAPGPIRMAAGANITGSRPRIASVRGTRPSVRPGVQAQGQIRGSKPGIRMPMKRPIAGAGAGGPTQKRRTDMLLPGKHDNEDCQVMAMQKQREGMPMIHSVQGAEDKLKLGGQISITKKPAPNKEANAMANVLASRGISIKQKPKSRTPSPERPVPHIPNLGSGVSIKHTSKSSNFTIPEAKVGGGMLSCTICKKMFMNQNSLAVHMSNAHPNSKVPVFKCDECPASYPRSLQLQHHKRVFHNVSGPNRELGLPVVDLSQEDTLKRLNNLGIYNFIPLANREQNDGCFGIPVVSVHNMHNGMTSGLQALGADGLLSLGPLKRLPN